VRDVSSPLCVRLTPAERARLRTVLDEYNVSDQHDAERARESTKRNVLDVARECKLYFARIYPLEEQHEKGWQFLAVSHSGLMLAKRVKGLPADHLEVSSSRSFCTVVSIVHARGASSFGSIVKCSQALIARFPSLLPPAPAPPWSSSANWSMANNKSAQKRTREVQYRPRRQRFCGLLSQKEVVHLLRIEVALAVRVFGLARLGLPGAGRPETAVNQDICCEQKKAFRRNSANGIVHLHVHVPLHVHLHARFVRVPLGRAHVGRQSQME